MTSAKLQIENLFLSQKKISQFAVAASILAHFVVVIVLKNVNFNKEIVLPPAIENYVDLGYQQFDEVPQVVDTPVEKVKDIVDTVPDKADPTPTAHEMQDQGSDVAGLQKEVTTVAKRAPAQGEFTTVPYYKVKPKYPKEALLSGIEGHVLLELDIEADGSVDNIKVTGGEKLNTFESEARRAVAKYKYKPFLDDAGHPIKKEKHIVRVDFKIEDQASNN